MSEERLREAFFNFLDLEGFPLLLFLFTSTRLAKLLLEKGRREEISNGDTLCRDNRSPGRPKD